MEPVNQAAECRGHASVSCSRASAYPVCASAVLTISSALLCVSSASTVLRLPREHTLHYFASARTQKTLELLPVALILLLCSSCTVSAFTLRDDPDINQKIKMLLGGARSIADPMVDGDDGSSPPRPKPRSLFGWGRNNAGQLGLGHNNDVRTPEVVSMFVSKEIRQVAVGGLGDVDGDGEMSGGFSLVVTSSRKVFAFGANSHGQLGVGDMVDRYAMVPVALPGHVRVTQVAAGKVSFWEQKESK
ncbi:hypothetical protein CBR_g6400 [Chara braunii]|uniref:Uncharacterized protein n=1 Tax=Chara braunii TaxID=69332 RepID=A0A388KJP5_CHABU|nr:hypothetical protein CBR_g6400 [Chara braunii]|eukprot:GBG70271.1 hypothetical protein CBR_g6400 [Chara braunii]